MSGHRSRFVLAALLVNVLAQGSAACRDSGLERVDRRDGDLREVGTLKNGKKHGQWLTLVEERLFILEHWDSGVAHGPRLSWYAGGSLLSDVRYVRGAHHGRSRTFWQDGKIAEIGWYYKNMRTGTWCEWNEDGTVAKIAELADDIEVRKELSPERPCPLTQGKGRRHLNRDDRDFD